MRLPRPSLRAVLFVSLSVATVGPLAGLAPTQIARWQEAQRAETDRELSSAAASLSRALSQAVDSDIRALETTAGEIGLHPSLDPVFLAAALRVHRQQFRGCDGAHVSGLDGRAVASDPPGMAGKDYSDRDFYRVMMRTGETAISPEVLPGRFLRNLSIHVGVPIRVTFGPDTGKAIGYLGASVGLEHLQQLVAGTVEALQDVRARVLDSRQHALVDSDPNGAAPLTDLSALPTYHGAPPDRVELRDGLDDRPEAVRAALTRISGRGLDWTVVVSKPLARIEEQGQRARRATVTALAAAFAFGIGMSLVLSFWLAGPIRRLAEYTARVRGGAIVPQPLPAPLDPREVAHLVDTVGSMVGQLQEQAHALRAREAEQIVLGRFKKEMEIAQRIQSGILPKSVEVPSFEVAATMRSAEEVSGDYYEILPTEGGCWIAIGDACGHGVNAGLLALMVQSALGALVSFQPGGRPGELLKAANALLFENIHNRLQDGDFVTLLLMRIRGDGQFLFAGAHEPFLIWRQASGKCAIIETEGVWLGLGPADDQSLPEGQDRLLPGDLLVLYSDGVVERGASARNPFGVERLAIIVERLSASAPQAICDEVVREARAWGDGSQEDDMTVLVLRYVG